jgi:hypothetical protein
MDDKLVVVSVDAADLTNIMGDDGTLFFMDTKWKWHQKTWSDHGVEAHIMTTLLVKKNGKKEAPAEEKLTQPTKTVQYNIILVTGVTDLVFSWRQRPPSWSTMSTLSCYHMIDVVLLF